MKGLSIPSCRNNTDMFGELVGKPKKKYISLLLTFYVDYIFSKIVFICVIGMFIFSQSA